MLDELCQALMAQDMAQQKIGLRNSMLHDLAGPMILDAAQGGLPNDNAIQVSRMRFLCGRGRCGGEQAI